MGGDVVIIVVRLILIASCTEGQDIHKAVKIVILLCRVDLLRVVQADDVYAH